MDVVELLREAGGPGQQRCHRDAGSQQERVRPYGADRGRRRANRSGRGDEDPRGRNRCCGFAPSKLVDVDRWCKNALARRCSSQCRVPVHCWCDDETVDRAVFDVGISRSIAVTGSRHISNAEFIGPSARLTAEDILHRTGIDFSALGGAWRDGGRHGRASGPAIARDRAHRRIQ